MSKNVKSIQYIQRNRSHRRRSLLNEVEILKEIDRLLEPEEQKRLSDRVRILEDLDQLFKNKSRWTKGCFARNFYGKRVASRSYDASSYCLLGGLKFLKRRYPPLVLDYTLNSLRHLANRMMPNLGIRIEADKMLDAGHCIMKFNDAKQTEFVHIKRLISRAIQQARRGSQVQMPEPLRDTKQALTKANPMKSVDKRDQRRTKERLSVDRVVPKPEPIAKSQQREKQVARCTYSK